ncbi:MAG: DUF6807 family protein [bacterium]
MNVLIITGANNHDWRQTTDALKKMYEGDGRFNVSVTEKPAELTAAELARYDVLVNNWTVVGKTGHVWGIEVEKAIEDFVAGGKGFVTFHAGSSCFADWPGFHKIVGGTWGKQTGHGAYHSFDVVIVDKEHPVTRGMKDFTIADELWHNIAVLEPTQGRKVLCRAMSSKEKGGTGKIEDVAMCTEFEKGRGFYSVLGHDVKAIESQGWRQLMLRGTEWAATGKVSGGVKKRFELSWSRTTNSIALMNSGNVVWKLNHDKAEGKPYFHPLSTIGGDVLTCLRPGDHPWHRAVWFSWKYINGLNYWEEDKKTGLSEGRTELTGIKVTTAGDYSAKIEMALSYHPPGKEEVLSEKRTLDIGAPGEDGTYRIDWASSFVASSTDVVLGRTPLQGEAGGAGWGGYAGLSVRMARETIGWKMVDSETRQDLAIHGKKALWIDVSGPIGLEKNPVGVAVFDHPSNIRNPSSWYVSKEMPYFSPALLFDSAQGLEKGKELT